MCHAPVSLRNDSDTHISLKRGHLLGLAEEIHAVVEGSSVDCNPGEISRPSLAKPILKHQEDDHSRLELAELSSTVRQVIPVPEEGSSVDCNPGEISRPSLAKPILKHQEDDNSRLELAELSSTVRQVTPVPEHLQDLWKRSCTHLTPDQSQVLAKVLVEYQDVFSRNDTDLGTFGEITHKIDTGDARPVRQKMRHTPASFEGEEKSHLEDLLKADVIEPSKSEWDFHQSWCVRKMAAFATASIFERLTIGPSRMRILCRT